MAPSSPKQFSHHTFTFQTPCSPCCPCEFIAIFTWQSSPKYSLYSSCQSLLFGGLVNDIKGEWLRRTSLAARHVGATAGALTLSLPGEQSHGHWQGCDITAIEKFAFQWSSSLAQHGPYGLPCRHRVLMKGKHDHFKSILAVFHGSSENRCWCKNW